MGWANSGWITEGLRIFSGIKRGMFRLGGLILVAIALAGCALPQISAEDRLFRSVQLELLDVVTLPAQTVADTLVGGLSALTYDPTRDVFYALSDDRGAFAPPRFYTLKATPALAPTGAPKIQSVEIVDVTTLKDETGAAYGRDRLDPEGMVLSPRQSLFIASEGVAATQSPPLLNEYDRQSGQLKTEFRLPTRFIPNDLLDESSDSQGVRDNQGFEALTVSPLRSTGEFEPFRLFVATESALAQDFDEDPAHPLTSRFLHYLIGPDQSTLLAEHGYPLSLEPLGAVSNGLTELLTLDQGGHFLALERVYGVRGFEVKLFQLAMGGATDISTLDQLPSLEGIEPIRKQLVLDFSTLDSPVPIDNLEGMAWGAPLPDGTASLWMISDNNFSDDQTTQLWLFRASLT